MKQFLLILILLSFAANYASLSAQSYCEIIFAKAEKLCDEKNYKAALAEFQNATTCDYDNHFKARRDSLQIQIFNGIELQKMDALLSKEAEVAARIQAQQSAQEALKAKALAESEKTKADSATVIAINERDRAEVARKNEALQKKIAEEKAAIAEALRLAQLSVVVRESKAYNDAICLAYRSLNIGWDSITLAPSYGAFGDALYSHPSQKYKHTLGKGIVNGELTHYQIVPNAGKIITAHRDNIIRLWPLNENPEANISSASKYILDLDVSPDGRYAAIANDDGSIIIWNLETTTVLLKKEHNAEVLSISFSSDSKKLISCSRDNTAKLWNLDGVVLQTFAHANTIYQAEFSPDGQSLFTRSADWLVKIWSVNGQLIQTLSHQSYAHFAKFSKDSKQLISCSSDGTVQLWEEGNNKPLHLPHADPVIKAWFSEDGKKILTQSLNNQIKVWDKSGKETNTYLMDGLVTTIHFFKNGNTLLGASDRSEMKFVHLSKDSSMTINNHTQAVRSIQASADEKFILSHSDDQKAMLWNAEGVRMMTLNHKTRLAPLISQDASYIVTSPDGIHLDITRNPLHVFIEMKAASSAPCEINQEGRKKYSIE